MVSQGTHRLGIVAQEQHDFAAAEQWYRKSLAIKEKLGDAHSAATTLAMLGMLKGLQKDYVASGAWLIKAAAVFIAAKDSQLIKVTDQIFMRSYREAPPEDQQKLEAMWREAGLGELPSEAA